jgi:hypothetical protein
MDNTCKKRKFSYITARIKSDKVTEIGQSEDLLKKIKIREALSIRQNIASVDQKIKREKRLKKELKQKNELKWIIELKKRTELKQKTELKRIIELKKRTELKKIKLQNEKYTKQLHEYIMHGTVIFEQYLFKIHQNSMNYTIHDRFQLFSKIYLENNNLYHPCTNIKTEKEEIIEEKVVELENYEQYENNNFPKKTTDEFLENDTNIIKIIDDFY